MVARLLSVLHRGHLIAVGLVVLMVVVTTGAYRVLTEDRTVSLTAAPAATTAPPGTPLPSPAPAVAPVAGQSPSAAQEPVTPSSASASPSGPPAEIKAVFFGDSIVAGSNTGEGNPIFTDVAARLLGWRSSNYGFPGSGFTTAGTFAGGRDYLARIQQLRGYTVDVLVLEGGNNDVNADPVALQNDIVAVVRAARALVPGITVVLMGPWSSTGAANDQLTQINAVMRALAGRAKIGYIDPIDENWITGTYPGSGNAAQYISADGHYPNAAGHAYFGQQVATDLKRLLPPRLLPRGGS